MFSRPRLYLFVIFNYAFINRGCKYYVEHEKLEIFSYIYPDDFVQTKFRKFQSFVVHFPGFHLCFLSQDRGEVIFSFKITFLNMFKPHLFDNFPFSSSILSICVQIFILQFDVRISVSNSFKFPHTSF